MPRVVATATAYKDLAGRGLDDCGLLEIASRTVGVPFVGVIAATLALMEIVRRLNQGPRPGRARPNPSRPECYTVRRGPSAQAI